MDIQSSVQNLSDQSQVAGSHASKRLTRTAILLGVLTILGSCIAGYFAYSTSRDKILGGVYENNLNIARILGRSVARSKDAKTEAEVLSELNRLWIGTEIRYSGSYLCAIRPNGKIVLHTGRPDGIGIDVIRQPLEAQMEGAPENLGELIQTRGEYVGPYVSRSGQQQVAAFSYSLDLDMLIAVHIVQFSSFRQR